MKTPSKHLKELKELARLAGASKYEVVRRNKHLVVDFWFSNSPRNVRVTMSSSSSDCARAIKNRVSDIQRQARVVGVEI